MHYTETIGSTSQNISLLRYHEHDDFGNHKIFEDAPPLANHTHTATGKTINNHSHSVISFFNRIFLASEDHDDHQKTTSKAEIDKHFLTLQQQLTAHTHSEYKTPYWHLKTLQYTCHLQITSPPPQNACTI